MPTLAPGPKGLPFIGCLPELKKDVLGLMMRSFAGYGDIVRFKMGPMTIHLVSHPDDIKRVLKNRNAFDKQTRTSKVIRQVTGESVLVNNGDAWERHRRLLQPAFAPLELKRFFTVISEATDELITELETIADRKKTIDIASYMMRITYRVIEKSLFSTDANTDMGALEQAIAVVLADTYRRIEQPVSIPHWLPTPRNRAYHRAMALLNERVYSLISEHYAQTGDDLLHRLCRDTSFTDTEMRNEVISLLIAGHETTANALTWFWHLLAQHPDAEEAILSELPNGPITAQDLSSLEATTRTVNEVMRLYPPIWAIVRRVVGEQELGGYDLAAGSSLVISPYVVHRHPEFWTAPDKFDPQRQQPDHHYACIPYGGGPRLCIGHNFARMEADIIVAKLMQRFRFKPLPDHPVEAHASIVLRPRQGLKVIVESR